MSSRSYNSWVNRSSQKPMNEDVIYCHCGIVAEVRTSWNDSNPSRRFYGCSKFGAKDACDFFLWYDPKICERATKVIPGLLRKMNKLEEENAKLQSEVRRLKEKSQVLCITLLCCLGMLVAVALYQKP